MRSALSRVSFQFSGFFSLLLVGGALSGCGPDFDPPSEMHTLRVLGVQKDKPYVQPGDTVTLNMLWEDASPKAPRNVTIAWSPPCENPSGDLYYNCFADKTVFGSVPTLGDTTSFTVPPDVIRPKPPPNAPYGLEYVFFAACAGKLAFQPPTSTTDSSSTGSIPIACLDPDTNQPLGSDDFVAGYTSVYSFQGFSNKNPIITGFEFNGQPLDATKVCLSSSDAMAPPTEDCTKLAAGDPTANVAFTCPDPDEPRCVPTCADDGKSSCHGYPLKPTLAQADNQEEDSVSAQLLGRHVTEQMWIDYYTDGGGFKSPVRLLNDATSGWNDNYGTDFYAPKDAKTSRVWALVHDNRGGVAWAGISIQTQ